MCIIFKWNFKVQFQPHLRIELLVMDILEVRDQNTCFAVCSLAKVRRLDSVNDE